MIHEDLVAERIAILTYTSIIRWLGDTDPTTSQLLTDILEKEEEHAEDLARLLPFGRSRTAADHASYHRKRAEEQEDAGNTQQAAYHRKIQEEFEKKTDE